MSMLGRIESILFVATKPVSYKKLALALERTVEEVVDSLKVLGEQYDSADRGLSLTLSGDAVQLVTKPAYAEVVAGFTKDETAGELTRAALETLAVVAYRSPVTKAEIEQIRGVNCTQSLRNLLIRGLIDEQRGATPDESAYSVTHDFLHHLGLSEVSVLPEYVHFHTISIERTT